MPFNSRPDLPSSLVPRRRVVRTRRRPGRIVLERLENRTLLSIGDLDTGFGVGGLVTTDFSESANAIPRAVAIQGDGKVIEAGESWDYHGISLQFDAVLVRVNTDGTPDPTFGEGGFVVKRETGGQITAVVVQADGKILVVAQGELARYNSDGSPDAGFGSSGRIPADPRMSGQVVAVQADGGIVVAGSVTGAGHHDFAVERLNADGSSDPSFGGGMVTTDIGADSSDFVSSVVVQADGKIVVGGSSDAPPNVEPGGHGAGGHLTVLRLNPDGSLDTGFGPAGTGKVVDGTVAGGARLALQSDARILATGADMIRLDTSGALDDSFGTGGRVAFAHGIPAVMADGRIMVAATDAVQYLINRYLADGSPDSSFGAGGSVSISGFGSNPSQPGLPSPAGMVVQADGKVVLGRRLSVEVYDAQGTFALERVNADGTLDGSYGNAGLVPLWVPGPGQNHANGLAIQADGKLVVVGASSTFASNGSHFDVARYNPDGSLDATFGAGGRVSTFFTVDPLYDSSEALCVAIQDDGKIVVAGDRDVARYNPDGSLDTYFGTGGKVLLPEEIRAMSIVIQNDGKIVVSGGSFVVARLNPDGSPDDLFGDGGLASTQFAPGSFDRAYGVALQVDRIVVVGYSQVDGGHAAVALARFTDAGILDASFGLDGLVTTQLGVGTDDFANGVVVKDGKIVVAGSSFAGDGSTGSFALARFDDDGLLDSSFGNAGQVTTEFGSLSPTASAYTESYATALVVQSDGRIVVAGEYLNVAAADSSVAAGFAVARYHGDGSLDATFGTGGRVATAIASIGNNAHAMAVVLQADGRIVVAGEAGEGLGASRPTGFDIALARYDGGPLNVVDQQQVASQLQSLIAEADSSGRPAQVTFQAAANAQVSSVVAAVNGLALDPARLITVTLDLGGGTYTTDTHVDAPPGVTLVIVNGALIGGSPALVVDAGNVFLDHVTATNATNAPTIVVNGGSLVVRNSTIQESTGYDQFAVLVAGGVVDLGTASDAGGNTININGIGEWVSNSGPNPIAAVADNFTRNGAIVSPSSLSGVVFADFNNDGLVDFGESFIGGVAITLTGTDDLGNHINLSRTSDSDGAYVFLNLRPGTYTLSEAQPIGYAQGINVVGNGGGTVSADTFDLHLAAGLDAMNYNYGERPAASGGVLSGQAAGIGFWNNKNGQALIRSLNGGAGTQLGDWLAATFPGMFGAFAGGNNLAGKSNADVATFFQSRFVLKGEKVDAQVLATALAVYVTNATLDSTSVGTQYGFTVAGSGVGTATFNVGTNGSAFGVADGTVMTVMDILLAADAQSASGVLYGGNAARRSKANNVFSAINQAGNIG